MYIHIDISKKDKVYTLYSETKGTIRGAGCILMLVHIVCLCSTFKYYIICPPHRDTEVKFYHTLY